MPLKLLFNAVKYLAFYSWVFLLSALIITVKYLFVYLKKMFDLPVDVILAIRESKQADDPDKPVQ
jgi:hypothetical protein